MTAGVANILVACGRTLSLWAVGSGRTWGPVAEHAAELPVQHAAVSPDRNCVYLACSDGGIGRAGTRHRLEMVPLAAGRQFGRPASIPLPQRPVHIAAEQGGARLHLAFNLPSAYACASLAADGTPSALQHYVSGAETAGWFAHQVMPWSGHGSLLLSCRGDDAVDGKGENPGSLRVLSLEGGQVRLLQVVAPSAGIGFGPRNCAASADGRFLYVVLERQNRLEVFARSGNVIGPRAEHAIPTLPAGSHTGAKQFAGDICVHPSGRFVYLLNRSRSADGHNGIAAFAIDPRNGQPHHLQSVALPGRHPRTIGLNAGGSLMAVSIMEPGPDAGHSTGLCVLEVSPDGRIRDAGPQPLSCPTGPAMWAAFHEPSH